MSTSPSKPLINAPVKISDGVQSQIFPTCLAKGYRTFREDRLPEERGRYEVLAELGQKPKTMIISCCDSRVSPEVIFNAAPGELFVVRNVANLVPPCEIDNSLHGTSAALEFAVQALKVENIVVMGHGRCGGVEAYLVQKEGIIETQPLSSNNFIGKWMTLLEPASKQMVCEDGDDFVKRRRSLEEAGIRMSIENLMTFSCVRTLMERGNLRLFGVWFDISSGELFAMDPTTKKFCQFR